MYLISELKGILGKNFTFEKRRIDGLARFLVSLITVRTVNLSEIALAFKSESKTSSSYKRLHRFLKAVRFDKAKLAKFLLSLFNLNGKRIYLTIDRTNWFLGKSKINFLVLGFAYEGLAIPLFWKLLPKSGNASGKEHASMVEKFLKRFHSSIIAGVLADREFANQDFFHYLSNQKIPFYIRIKSGLKVKFFHESKPFPAQKLFTSLTKQSHAYHQQPLIVHGQKCYLSAGRSERGELMIIATNQLPENAVAIYLRRWEIENLFQALKSRGFDLETTRVTKLDRLDTLMSVLTIAFAWMHRIGEWIAKKKPIRWKIFANNTRHPQSTYFRYGLNAFRQKMLKLAPAKVFFKHCLNLLKTDNLTILEVKI